MIDLGPADISTGLAHFASPPTSNRPTLWFYVPRLGPLASRWTPLFSCSEDRVEFMVFLHSDRCCFCVMTVSYFLGFYLGFMFFAAVLDFWFDMLQVSLHCQRGPG